MKSQFVDELVEGMHVDSGFVLSHKELRHTRAGETYLTLTFADRSGRIAGVWFRPSRDGHAIPAGTVARVVGTVTSYRGNRRISVESLTALSRFDETDMIATTQRERSALIAEFKSAAARVVDPDLRRILKAVFGDATFFEKFAMCPGTVRGHHAFLGGLIEHSVAVTGLCAALAQTYPEVDADLLVTAALLHDIGMVDALNWRTAIEENDEGRLLGHVLLGERRLRDATRTLQPRISSTMLARLSHALAVHHADIDASPGSGPVTLEARILNQADHLDVMIATDLDHTLGSAVLEERWAVTGDDRSRVLHVPGPVACSTGMAVAPRRSA